MTLVETPAAPPPDAVVTSPAPTPRRLDARRVLAAALLAVPASLTLWLGFHAGGFFAGATGVAALVVLALLALHALLAREPARGLAVWGIAAVGALAGLATWAMASAGWSGAEGRALLEYDRALLYALAVLAGVVLGAGSTGRLRWLVRLQALALVTLCVVGLLSRLIPGLVEVVESGHQPERLAWPVTYWNAMGLIAALALASCGHLTLDPREARIVRVIGAAAAPAAAATLVLTASRGGILATIVAAVVYVVLARPRSAPTAGLAVAGCSAVAAWIALHSGPFGGPDEVADLAGEGRRVLVAVGACMLAAGALRALALLADEPLERLRLPERHRRRILAGIAATAVVGAAGAALAMELPRRVESRFEQFTTYSYLQGGGGGSRLTSFNNNGRLALWDVAAGQWEQDRLRGAGAGTFVDAWRLHREWPSEAYDGHSLYVETAGELGIVGLALLTCALLALLGGASLATRRGDRAPAACAAALLTGFCVSAASDWHWEMPVLVVGVLVLAGAAGSRSVAAVTRRPGRWPALGGRVAAVGTCVLLAGVPLSMARSQEHLDRAAIAFERGDCATTDAEASRALEAEPRRPQAWRLIAFCAVRAGQDDRAVRAVERARSLEPDSAPAWYDTALVRAAAGRDPRAASRRAHELDPLNAAAAEIDEAFREARDPEARRRIALRAGVSEY